MSKREAREVKTTPLSAIRQHCLWCSNGQPSEVRLCPSTSCPVHAYRLRVLPASEKRSSLKAIHARCLDCVSGSTKEVADCHSACALNPFRFGRNPNYGESKRSRARLLIRRLTKESSDQEPISKTKEATQ